MAVMLDQELREGWAESHSENLQSLKQVIFSIQKEAAELLMVVG